MTTTKSKPMQVKTDHWKPDVDLTDVRRKRDSRWTDWRLYDPGKHPHEERMAAYRKIRSLYA